MKFSKIFALCNICLTNPKNRLSFNSREEVLIIVEIFRIGQIISMLGLHFISIVITMNSDCCTAEKKVFTVTI